MSGYDKIMEELAKTEKKVARKGFKQKSFWIKSSLENRLKRILKRKGFASGEFISHAVEFLVSKYEENLTAEKENG